ncbi:MULTISPECIES: hypothetical protein [unclassified Acinetobacter]|jgi:hypothetical protein|uniref:hypothetical protein n=1 Tax=unclassified Acinetobacter TaxID=196816 RepID=UPI001907D94B|nr:hypothetical protein [Acinetobacter sp. CS-2]QQN40113.1 hypothetical protein JFY49_03985 [Acinetobacter sp. CS-2]
MQHISKENIGLVGEYLVAAELCKRGIYAQLTLGNHKKTDLLIETDDGAGCVSVKTKRGTTWPKVKGIWKECDFIVFVDFKDKSINDIPDFYVLNTNDWKEIIEEIGSKRKGCFIDPETNTVYWDDKEGYLRWEGCQISVTDVKKYQDKWPLNKTAIK